MTRATVRERVSALALVAVLLVSAVAGAVALAGGAAAASPPSETPTPPSGMVAVADDDISDLRPSAVRGNVTAGDLAGSVFVSEHAATTEVDIVTRTQAAEVANGASPSKAAQNAVCGSPAAGKNPVFDCNPKLSLVISDDVHHEGRRVALDADVVESALGYVPKRLAVANNETGETWTAPASVDDGYLVTDIKHFSSNSVTFTGTVEVNATPAQDGSQLSYPLENLSATTDPVVNVTGVENTEWANTSATAVSPTATHSLAVYGNADPGGSGASPTLTVTNTSSAYNPSEVQGDGGGGTSLALAGDGGFDTTAGAEAMVRTKEDRTTTKIRPNIEDSTNEGYNPQVDIYVHHGQPDGNYGDGTLVKSGWNPDWTTGYQTITLDQFVTFEAGVNHTLEFVTTYSDGDGTKEVIRIDTTNGADAVWYDYDQNGGQSYQNYPDLKVGEPRAVSSLSVSDGAGNSLSFGDLGPGETKTLDWPGLSVDATNLDFSGGGGGTFDYYLEMRERTLTPESAVELNNGNWLNHSGGLAEGETVSMTGNSSWLVEGTNTLNVSVGDGSLSADAPTPAVEMYYSHEAGVTRTVEYSSEALTERYSVGQNFSSEYSDVQMNISFTEEVYEMRDIELSKNGGSWSAVASSDYRITDANKLVVDVGDASSGDTVEVRANGSRADTHNMSIRVEEPSTTSDLDSLIHVESVGDNPSMRVAGGGGTHEFIRYVSKPTWSDADAYVRVRSDGRQSLRLPNIGAGDEFRLNSHGTKVMPETNDVDVAFADSSQEPRLVIEPGAVEGDEVTFRYYNTVSGSTYVLQSVTQDVTRDSGEASSPVDLLDDDSAETLEIFLDDDGSTNTDGGGDSSTSGAPLGGAKEATAALPPLLILGVALALSVVLYYVDARTPGKRRYLLYVTLPPLWLLTAELLGVPVISVPIQAASEPFGRVVPAIALAVVGTAVYFVYTRYIKGAVAEANTPDEVTRVNFNVDEGDRGSN